MRLWIRTEANSAIGYGHLVRMLALADAAVAKGFNVSIFTNTPVSIEVPASITIKYISDDTELLSESMNCKPDWLFVDGYQFTESQCLVFNQVAKYLGHIDDLALSLPLNSSLLVSPAGEQFLDFYQRQFSAAKLLCGLSYVLLRPEFMEEPSQYTQRESFLISFGGADVANLSLKAIRQLKYLNISSIELVVTDAMKLDESDELLNGVSILRNLNAAQMVELMGRAKFAIGAAGSTMFELATQGVPSVFAIVADNQTKAATALVDAGWCFAFDATQNDVEQRMTSLLQQLLTSDLLKMHQLAYQTVDAFGAQRIVDAMEEISGKI